LRARTWLQSPNALRNRHGEPALKLAPRPVMNSSANAPHCFVALPVPATRSLRLLKYHLHAPLPEISLHRLPARPVVLGKFRGLEHDLFGTLADHGALEVGDMGVEFRIARRKRCVDGLFGFCHTRLA